MRARRGTRSPGRGRGAAGSARRRWEELRRNGLDAELEDVLADIRARDARDGSRSAAPLLEAGDAARLDTSELAIDAAIEAAIEIVEARRGD